MLERLELVPSKAIVVCAFLRVRSVLLTASVLQPEPQDTATRPYCWGHLLSGLVWLLSDRGRQGLVAFRVWHNLPD